MSLLHTAADTFLIAAGNNPFEGVKPDPTALGTEANGIFTDLVKIAWGVGLLVIGIYGVMGITKIVTARSSGHPGELASASTSAIRAGIAFALLLCIGIIVQILISVTKTGG